jgi:ubiquinone/menaquinone biosynthesis C-methylase UbiE
MAAMGDLASVARTWERLARSDPLWAVLTDPSRRGGRWALDEFYATGRREVDDVMAYAERLVPGLGRESALDFGCGVGRLTLPLAGYFERVTGVDISPTMLALARERADASAGEESAAAGSCEFVLNQRADLRVFADASFDFVYSGLTLQHVPPDSARCYIGELVRVLRQGGLLLFQLPERRVVSLSGRLIDSVPGLRRARSAGIEMHGAPRASVLETLERAGARVLEVQPDETMATRWPGWRYAATKG